MINHWTVVVFQTAPFNYNNINNPGISNIEYFNGGK